METSGIIFGLFDNSAAISDPAVAAKYRDLTISWSRYDYHGPIIEAATIDEILSRAAECEARHCFVQSYGHVLGEQWHPEHWKVPNFLAALESWLAESSCLVAGQILEGADDGWWGLDTNWLVVDLERYRASGQPSFGNPQSSPHDLPQPLVARSGDHIDALRPSEDRATRRVDRPGWGMISASLESGWPVVGAPAPLVHHSLDLEPESLQCTQAFSGYLDGSIERYLLGTPDENLAPGQRSLLDTVARQATRAQRGVFLLNIESYDDVETKPAALPSPLRALYTVAAGFKPNRILATHGFSDDTRVVFFDYSTKALDIRRDIVEGWDGRDFPDFVQGLLQRFPHPDTFYQLWADRDPDETTAVEIELAWRRELERWGGETIFREHWRRYRELPHEYVPCDLMVSPEPLLARMNDEPGSVLWFSNAFFTMCSNWYYTPPERRGAYERFMARLSETAPDLYLYGADHMNTSVNFFQAAGYWDEYQKGGGSELHPTKLHRYEIRS